MGSLSPRGPLLPAQVSLLFVLDDGAFGITLTHNTLVPEVFFCHKERIGRRGGGEEERRRGGEEERERERERREERKPLLVGDSCVILPQQSEN